MLWSNLHCVLGGVVELVEMRVNLDGDLSATFLRCHRKGS